ncbi:MAG: UDP-2,3-diacylglucosamine diphosphatase, partial [Gammaproteobacteria bacterium]|nr:UDP-2,3-diacylglucosamine diphosphatase [Gammaproteobacteria bacterium]
LLCTDDTDYMAFREMVRNAQWQAELLSKPLEERRQIAAGMRRHSREQTGGKPEAIMDVNQQAVLDAMSGHRVQRLIHGHTHRPAIHELTVAGQPAQRIVLGDWYEQGSVLECRPEGCTLQSLAAG